MTQQLEPNWKYLSRSGQDLAMDIVEYAHPQTPAGCAARLESLLASDRITKSQYDEIVTNVTFEIVTYDR